jgi:enediyne biosynthesis protein E4
MKPPGPSGWQPRRRATQFVAVLVVAVALLANAVEVGAANTSTDIGRRLHFTPLRLAEPSGRAPRSIRAVHPSLERISAWISSVGAAVAVGDLDGDGLANDLCHVDPRWDSVLISPAPGAAQRYEPFTLDAPAALYDASTMAPMGCTLGDINSDGLLDAVVYYWGRTPLLFVRRAAGPLRAGRFEVLDIVPTGERWFSNALTLADVDGDGRLDVIVGNYFPDGARILGAKAGGRESMQDSMSNSFNGGRDRVLRQLSSAPAPAPDARFEDVPASDGKVASGWTLAIGAADLDGDLRPEIYFANDFGPDRLLHNRSVPGEIRFDLVAGQQRLSAPASKVLGRDSFKGMGVDFADVNRDGRLDIAVSNITTDFGLHESNFLFVSQGAGSPLNEYVDASRPLGFAQAGWAWDVRFGDFDNDGDPEIAQATGFIKGRTNRWPELHELASGNDAVLSNPGAWPELRLGTDLSGHQPNHFFVRDGSQRYVDAGPEVGLASRAVTRGLATADVDGDGDLDLVVANQWGPSYLYRNECTRCGRSLVLNLSDRTWPAAPGGAGTVGAIGASVLVRFPDGRQLTGQVDGGSGHSGKKSQELHFGLGDVAPDTNLTVELAWRDLTGIPHHQTMVLTPGRHNVVLDRIGDNG